MRLQPNQLLADIAALGEQRCLLRQPLRFDARAAQQLAQPFVQSLLKRLCGARPDFLHLRAQIANRCAPLVHLGRHGRPFPLAKPVQQIQCFLGGFQQRLLQAGVGFRGFARLQHSRHPQGRVQIGFALRAKVGSRFPKGLQIGCEQWPIQTGGIRRRGPIELHVDLQVPARDLRLHGVAYGAFKRVQFRGHMKMHIQPAMIDALDADGDLAIGRRLLHSRETRHTARAHKSITLPASTNCSSCSRW